MHTGHAWIATFFAFPNANLASLNSTQSTFATSIEVSQIWKWS